MEFQRYEEAFPIDEIVLYPNNPRQGDIGAISESIKAHGFYGSIIVQDSTNLCLVGNHRLQAMRMSGNKTIPVSFIDCSDDEAQQILHNDNHTSDLATYDQASLAEQLVELAQKDKLIGSGYDREDLQDLLDDLDKEDKKKTGDPICPNCGYVFTK